MGIISFAIIFFMGIALVIMLLFPLLIGIPIYKLILTKFRRSMLVLMLNPQKRLEVKESETKSSIIKTKKGNFIFLNTPDAVYSMWGIPTAIAYHKYGAILPPQNIVHASKMREFGFKNIGEVELARYHLQSMLDGDNEDKNFFDTQKNLIDKIKTLESELNTFLFYIEPEDVFTKAIESEHFPQELRKQFKAVGYKLNPEKPEIKQIDECTWTLKSNPESFNISKEKIILPDGGEKTKIAVYRVLNDKEQKQHEYEHARTELSQLNTQIEEVQQQLSMLENITIEENGIIKIQDIFNFLNKNLSTDVLFSLTERMVAEELKGMRDYFGKFQEMLPTIITLIIVFVIAYLIVSGGAGGGGGLSGIGESITHIIPNIGGTP